MKISTVGAGLCARPYRGCPCPQETSDRHGGLSLRRTISKAGQGFFNNPDKGGWGVSCNSPSCRPPRGQLQNFILSRRTSAVSKDGRRVAVCDRASFDTNAPFSVAFYLRWLLRMRKVGAELVPSEVERPLLRMREMWGLFQQSPGGENAAPQAPLRTI